MVRVDLRAASCQLPMPDSPGAFVVCMYDFASKCRVNTVPYFVTGPERTLDYAPIELHLETEVLSVRPYQRLEVTFPEGLLPGYPAMFREERGDNDGLNHRYVRVKCHCAFPTSLIWG